jgi:hypothetical protein
VSQNWIGGSIRVAHDSVAALASAAAMVAMTTCQSQREYAATSRDTDRQSGFIERGWEQLGTIAPKHQGKRGSGPTRKQDESTG